MRLAALKPTREDAQDARLLTALLTTPELHSMTVQAAVHKLYRMGMRASRRVETNTATQAIFASPGATDGE